MTRNLHAQAYGTVQVPDRDTAPNSPDVLSNGKNFVFLHGYNVNQQQSRAWGSEMFKRMYWSGSRAKFYNVSWRGDETQIGHLTYNYHINVEHGFQTAPAFAQFINNLSGETTACAHSLGNMVVFPALNPPRDANGSLLFAAANITRHFAFDAAVAAETIDGNLAFRPEMSHSDWDSSTPPPPANDTTRIDETLWASEWWDRFPADDSRHKLTWRGRFAETSVAAIYNFFSSGEEVLNFKDTKPTATFLSIDQLAELITPVGELAWYYQELMKGMTSPTSVFHEVLGSDYGGWSFGTNYWVSETYQNPPEPPETIVRRPTRAEVAAINWTEEKIRTEPLFLFGTTKQIRSIPNQPLEDVSALYGPNGNDFAERHFVKLLADMVPARTVAMGREEIPQLGEINVRNFDLSTQFFQAGWPDERVNDGDKGLRWLHSDAHDVAYFFNHRLFQSWVELGNLNTP